MDPAFDCRVCKKVQPHTIVVVTNDLPDFVHVFECRGCGVLGVMSWKQDIDA